jgi:hypothetical protein
VPTWRSCERLRWGVWFWRLVWWWNEQEGGSGEIYWCIDNNWWLSEMCYRVLLKTHAHFLYYSTLRMKNILSRSALSTWKLVNFLYCGSKELKLFIKNGSCVVPPPRFFILLFRSLYSEEIKMQIAYECCFLCNFGCALCFFYLRHLK